MKRLSLIQRSTVTVSKCVDMLNSMFVASNIGEPRESANYIVAHALQQKTINACSPIKKLSTSQLEHIFKMTNERLKRRPIQYIIGGWDFSGIELKLRPPVFIPRPETEELVELICKNEVGQKSTKFLEVGCGSGAISLALLNKMKSIICTAIDINNEACSLTELNCKKLNLDDRMTILNKSFFEYVSTSNEKFDFLVSNPPYIPSRHLFDLQEEIKNYEDIRALDGGEKGFDAIENILSLAPRLILNNGSIWLEIDESHYDMLNEFVYQKKNLKLVSIEKDFSKKYRFCHVKIKHF